MSDNTATTSSEVSNISSNVSSSSMKDNERTTSLIVHALYFFMMPIIGLIVAYIQRGSYGPDAQTHMRYAIGTFWKGVAYSVIALILSSILAFIHIGLIAIVWLYSIAVGLWYIIRIIKGFVRAIDRKPIDNPGTWFV